jgi:hypothetical protein
VIARLREQRGAFARVGGGDSLVEALFQHAMLVGQ